MNFVLPLNWLGAECYSNVGNGVGEKTELRKDLLVGSVCFHCGFSGKHNRLLELEALCCSSGKKLDGGSPVQTEGKKMVNLRVAIPSQNLDSHNILWHTQQTWQTEELISVSRTEMTTARESCAPLQGDLASLPSDCAGKTNIPGYWYRKQNTHSIFWVYEKRKDEFLIQWVCSLKINRAEA